METPRASTRVGQELFPVRVGAFIVADVLRAGVSRGGFGGESALLSAERADCDGESAEWDTRVAAGQTGQAKCLSYLNCSSIST